jgi:imidazole glycerol-phosphate synthase subunit HisH
VIALIDYGAGNLASVRKALGAVGAEVFEPGSPGDLRAVSGIIVPGVGHFGATSSLDDGWRRAVLDAIRAGTPLLGICLGMQWLFDGSDEAPGTPGLGVLPGRITRLPLQDADGTRVKVPHVGWNRLEMPPSNGASVPSAAVPRLLAGVPPGSYVYFTHAYAAPVTGDCPARTVHGRAFAAAVERGPVWGVQFHPEKSGPVGLSVLANFVTAASGRRPRDAGRGARC